MALIKCPECDKEVSNKAQRCIYCGFPLTESINCIINGKVCDMTRIFELVSDVIDGKVESYIANNEYVMIMKSYTNLSPIGISKFWHLLLDGERPTHYTGETQEEFDRKHAKPKCPTCGSTDIQKIGVGERVASVATLGLISKKINKTFKCKNCKYTW